MTPDKTSIKGLVYAALFGALTAAGAFIVIPLPPVPITAQTFFLNVSAILLGGQLGALSQFIYVMLGVVGIPVFAGGKAGSGSYLRSHRRLFTGFYHRRLCHRDDKSNEKKRGHFLAYLFHADRNVDNLFFQEAFSFLWWLK